MDMQGTPIGGTNQGQKVTTDPRSRNAINEATGPVASDSLAAESYNRGGGFAENTDARPSGVSGSSSTWNNTDTSGAQTLDSALDAPRRQDDDTDGTGRYAEALGGQGQFSGKHNETTGAYSGGPTGSHGSSGGYERSSGNSGNSGYPRNAGNSGNSGKDTTGSFSNSGADSYDNGGSAGTAPNYTLNTQGNFQHSKPKGNNITEGGFQGEGTNYNSGIGTSDDPGREALQKMANSSARAAPAGSTQYGRAGDEQPFEALDRDERA